MSTSWNIETIAVQGGYTPSRGEARVAPATMSTTYAYDEAQQLVDIFDLKSPGHIYSRLSNPTVSVLEEKVAALDGGTGALALASGQAAITAAILTIAQAGDHILSTSRLYGGTVNLFSVMLKRFAIDVTFVDPELSNDELASQIKPNTKCIYGETLANPALSVLDIKRLADLAHGNNIPLIVDNTLATPYLLQPKEHGADIIVYSSSKYLDGHARALGGIVVDCGTFDWSSGKFPQFTEPDPSYHDIVYSETFGNSAYIVKARAQILRDMGAAMSPMNGWITIMGLETLHLRMERHSENALAVAEFLEGHPKVQWVNYPSLSSGRAKELTETYLPRGASGVLTFGVKGGYEKAKMLMEEVKLARMVVHVSDTRTGILHPASTTHRQLSVEDMKAAGVTEDMMRFSVGIENREDIIHDLQQALDKL